MAGFCRFLKLVPANRATQARRDFSVRVRSHPNIVPAVWVGTTCTEINFVG